MLVQVLFAAHVACLKTPQHDETIVRVPVR